MNNRLFKKPHPSRLTVEVTTRCNMSCAMCVKQTAGNSIGDSDMTVRTFYGLKPLFPHLESLVLTGIGEPLLHPRLADFAATARSVMQDGADIGFQTNGRLMDGKRAAELRDAGVNRVCVSVDSVSSDVFRAMRAGGELREVERAFAALRDAQDGVARFDPGAETVLTKDTLGALPDMVRWIAARGGRFMIVSHMLPYAQHVADQVAHPSYTDAALAMYERYEALACAEGLSLETYLDVLWRWNKNEEERRIVELVREMLEEARRLGAWIRPQRLLDHDTKEFDRMAASFSAARDAAREEGVELSLPALVPNFERRCDFVEEGRAFVDVDGRMSPCYFLWHRYVCHLDGRRKPVTPVRFGGEGKANPLEVWNHPDFVQFRKNVVKYDYPYCLDCAMTPCDLIETDEFEMDCYGREVPCGDCPWALGLYRCLG